MVHICPKLMKIGPDHNMTHEYWQNLIQLKETCTCHVKLDCWYLVSSSLIHTKPGSGWTTLSSPETRKPSTNNPALHDRCIHRSCCGWRPVSQSGPALYTCNLKAWLFTLWSPTSLDCRREHLGTLPQNSSSGTNLSSTKRYIQFVSMIAFS